MFDSFQQNINLTGANFEAQVIDSTTNEKLGAIMDKEGSRSDKKQFTSWQEFETQLRTLAMRFACRVKNAKVGDDSRKDCEAIEAPVPAKT